jgi:Uncharacterized protein conserved in bacteria (DUF2191).
MATNLDIDNTLLNEALIIGMNKSKKETVNAALKEYIQYRKQLKIKELFNSIEYDKGYNYKKQRSKK